MTRFEGLLSIHRRGIVCITQMQDTKLIPRKLRHDQNQSPGSVIIKSLALSIRNAQVQQTILTLY